MIVEGRKNQASVTFAGFGTPPPIGGAVIDIMDRNAYLSAMQDRLPSRANC